MGGFVIRPEHVVLHSGCLGHWVRCKGDCEGDSAVAASACGVANLLAGVVVARGGIGKFVGLDGMLCGCSIPIWAQGDTWDQSPGILGSGDIASNCGLVDILWFLSVICHLFHL